MSDNKLNDKEFGFVNQILKNKQIIDESYKFNTYFKLYTEFIDNFVNQTNEKEEKSIQILVSEMEKEGISNDKITKILLNYKDKMNE